MLRLPEFSYAAPTTVAEAARLLHEHRGEAMLVAGGTDVWPNLKRRQFHPRVLVGLGGLKELRGIRSNGHITLGAMASLTEVAEHPAVRAEWAGLAAAASQVATPQLRNQGTVGGNLCLNTRCNYYNQLEDWRLALGSCMKAEGTICQVAPGSARCWAVSSSDTAPVLAAIGARIRLFSHAGGEREVVAGGLYQDDGISYLTRLPDEVVTAVDLPDRGTWDRTTYLKLRRRGSFDFPVLGVAAAVRFGDGGKVDALSVVLGAVASAPVVLPEAGELFRGRSLDDPEATAQLQAVATKRSTPMDNTDGDQFWRRRVVKVYVARALQALAQ